MFYPDFKGEPPPTVSILWRKFKNHTEHSGISQFWVFYKKLCWFKRSVRRPHPVTCVFPSPWMHNVKMLRWKAHTRGSVDIYVKSYCLQICQRFCFDDVTLANVICNFPDTVFLTNGSFCLPWLEKKKEFERTLNLKAIQVLSRVYQIGSDKTSEPSLKNWSAGSPLLLLRGKCVLLLNIA